MAPRGRALGALRHPPQAVLLLAVCVSLAGGCTPADFISDVAPASAAEVNLRQVDEIGGTLPVEGPTLSYPRAVAGDGADIFVLDAGRGELVHVPRAALQSARALRRVGDANAQIALDDDETLVIADPRRGELRRIDAHDGTLLNRLRSGLRRPVDVAIGGVPPSLWVLDNGRGELLQLGRLGAEIANLGGIGSALPGSRSFRAIAAGTDRIYVLSRDGAIWSVDATRGDDIRQLHTGEPQAASIAVDDCGRLYRAYWSGQLVVSGPRGQRSRVGLDVDQATDLWVHRDELFVADGPGARVVVYRVSPPCR